MLTEQRRELLALLGFEACAASAEQVQPAAIPGELRKDLAREAQQVPQDHADDMEAVSDNQGAGKPTAHECPVAVRQVDADHPDLVAPPQATEETLQLRLALAGRQVEDAVVFKVAEGRREALSAMQRVLVDAEDRGQSTLSRSLALHAVNWA